MYCEVKELEGEDGPGVSLSFPMSMFLRELAGMFADELGPVAVKAMVRVAARLDLAEADATAA